MVLSYLPIHGKCIEASTSEREKSPIKKCPGSAMNYSILPRLVDNTLSRGSFVMPCASFIRFHSNDRSLLSVDHRSTSMPCLNQVHFPMSLLTRNCGGGWRQERPRNSLLSSDVSIQLEQLPSIAPTAAAWNGRSKSHAVRHHRLLRLLSRSESLRLVSGSSSRHYLLASMLASIAG